MDMKYSIELPQYTNMQEIVKWCEMYFGYNRKSHTWEVFYSPNGRYMFCFRNEDDYTLFNLTWG